MLEIMDEEKIREMIKEKGVNNADCKDISMIEILSESFIREFKDRGDWNWISDKQSLSDHLY